MPNALFFALDAKFKYEELEAGDDIGVFLDAVTDHLAGLGVEDVLVVVDKAARTFSVSQLVASSSGETIETVVGKGMGILRTAFHACNGGTAEWPTPREALLGVSVEPVEVRLPAVSADLAPA